MRDFSSNDPSTQNIFTIFVLLMKVQLMFMSNPTDNFEEKKVFMHFLFSNTRTIKDDFLIQISLMVRNILMCRVRRIYLDRRYDSGEWILGGDHYNNVFFFGLLSNKRRMCA